MADISKITLLDGQAYDIKDAVARAAIPAAATVFPSMDGVANKGSTNTFARGDHRHPTDTSQFCLDYQIGTEITAGQDLNNFTSKGNYYSSKSNITNVPDNCNSAFKLIVIQNKIGAYQILFCLRYPSKPSIYYRGYDGTNWENWQSLGNNLYKGSRQIISSTVYLNSYKTPGTYSFAPNITVVSSPLDSSYGFTMFVIEGNNTQGHGCYQIIFPIDSAEETEFTANVYFRRYSSNADGTGWTNWVNLSSPTTVNGHTVLSDVPANAVFTDTTYTPASSAPGKVASSSSTGTSTNYARQDHTHGIDLATGDSNGQVKIAGQNVSVKGLGSLAYADSVTTVNGHTVQSDVPANAVFTDTTYTPASANPLMDGTAAVGTSTKYAREDHVHPRDSKVAALEYDVTEISTGDDLDDYITPGTYYCATATIASNVSNIPEGVGAAFKLYVIGIIPSRYYQLLLFNNDAHLMFYRYYYNGSWFSWHEVDNPSKVNGHNVLSDVPANLAVNGLYYGECDTAAATAAKTVTLISGDGFSLVEGAKVCIRFTNANSASSPTLNVNDTGAKSIMRYGTTAIGTTAGTYGCWSAGGVALFVFDGTNWIEHYWYNNTYSSMTVAEYTAGTATTGRLMTAARLKAAIKLHSAPEVYTATIPTTGWTTASYGAYIDVTFTGATFAADDTVFVDLNLSSDTNLQLINDSWACLLRATPTASSAIIRFKFREIPTVAIPVRAVVT